MAVGTARASAASAIAATFKALLPWRTPSASSVFGKAARAHAARRTPAGEAASAADHRRLAEAGGRGGEHLVSGLGAADRMLALGRERLVAGDRRPAAGEQLHLVWAEVHHRLDG